MEQEVIDLPPHENGQVPPGWKEDDRGSPTKAVR